MLIRLTLILIFCNPLIAMACEMEWLEFVANPSAIAHEALAKEIASCKAEGTRCTRPSSQVVGKLARLVEANNSWAIDIAFSALPALDGGDLEDVVRALGLLTESNPTTFLDFVKQRHLSDYQLRGLLLMLPLDTVDSPHLKIDRIHKRIDSLSAVNHPQLKDVRDEAVQILRQRLTELTREDWMEP